MLIDDITSGAGLSTIWGIQLPILILAIAAICATGLWCAATWGGKAKKILGFLGLGIFLLGAMGFMLSTNIADKASAAQGEVLNNLAEERYGVTLDMPSNWAKESVSHVATGDGGLKISVQVLKTDENAYIFHNGEELPIVGEDVVG